MCTGVVGTVSGSDHVMVPSFLCAAMVMCHVSWAVPAYSRGLLHTATDEKSQRYKRKFNGSDEDSGSVAYMPAYAIPDGSPVDPCVTCRPRKTTPSRSCRRNTGISCSTSAPNGTTVEQNSSKPTITTEKSGVKCVLL